VENAQVARLFAELADLLEIAGENPFKTRAYRNFARTAREHGELLAAIATRGELEALPGVGKAIAAKVDAAVHTGSFPALDRARAQVPASVQRLLEVPDLGAKLVRVLWKDAGIQSLGELAYFCEENKLAHLAGVGPERQARVHEAVRALLEKGDGALLAMAVMAARGVASLLRAAGAAEVRAVGDARRGVEIVRSLLVLVRGIRADAVVAAIDAKPELEGARAQAAADGATFVLHGLSVRVRVVPDAQWVLALFAGTGDADHLAWLGARAKEIKGEELGTLCARVTSEDAVYQALGLSYVPPELREGATPEVPEALVEPEDIRGFFHVHTDWSDGTASVLGMVRAASRAGYDYVGITDHSRAAAYANGLDPARLAEQAKAIAMARREAKGCAILHGIEVDILADGSLDLPDDVLAELDFVIASVHTKLSMPEDEMTARIVRAVSHPLVTILGHPTGRLLLARRGFAFDLDAVVRAAVANDSYLEINANAQRLDLSDVMVRRAAKAGARFAIDPDAHAEHAVEETLLGVMVARRAGLTRDQVLNARSREGIEDALRARKKGALRRMGRS
jgi:DNA polymerase (family 10)